MVGSVLLTIACADDDDPSQESAATADAGDDDAGAGKPADAGGKADAKAEEHEPDDAIHEGGTDALEALPSDVTLPIVFVHGFAGSAQQFDSQAQRFVVNGYPAERLYAYEHDGAGLELGDFVATLDTVIDQMREKFDSDKVYLIGHSRGTSVSNQYLSDSAHAEKVAKYIALDGAGCPQGSVPCVAPAQTTNTRMGQTHRLPGQKHVEVATSKESFEVQFEFLFGKKPEVLDIVKQRAPVVISGRAVNFPANTGREGVRLDIWEVASDTGLRRGTKALETFDIGADGAWGPITVDPDKHYEFVLTSPDQPDNGHHFYMQHFLRSTPFVRLLSGPPDSDARKNSNVSENHSSLTVSRMREWTPQDVLEIASGDGDARNVISDKLGAASIAIYLQDDAATPKETTLELLPWFPEQPFQTGVDIYLPASTKPDGTITLTNQPRGDTTQSQVIHVPNWASSQHTVSVLFADYPQP